MIVDNTGEKIEDDPFENGLRSNFERELLIKN